MPLIPTCSTSPRQPASETSRLLPPPSTKRGSECLRAWSTAAATSNSDSACAYQRAGPPTLKVVKGANGTFSWILNDARLPRDFPRPNGLHDTLVSDKIDSATIFGETHADVSGSDVGSHARRAHSCWCRGASQCRRGRERARAQGRHCDAGGELRLRMRCWQDASWRAARPGARQAERHVTGQGSYSC